MIDWTKTLRTKHKHLPVTLLSDKIKHKDHPNWTHILLITKEDGFSHTCFACADGTVPYFSNYELENVPEEKDFWIVIATKRISDSGEHFWLYADEDAANRLKDHNNTCEALYRSCVVRKVTVQL